MTSEYEGMTAFLYARVSTDNKGQDTATQIRNMREWCSKNGVTILKTFTEEKSAKDTDRPVFNQLIGEIQTRNMKALAYLPDGRVDPKTVHVNIVLAWQESRISRNEDDMTDILAILKTWGVVLRYVASSAKPEERGGRLLHNISTWEGETENQLKSLNTKQGMSNASLKGSTAAGGTHSSSARIWKDCTTAIPRNRGSNWNSTSGRTATWSTQGTIPWRT